MSKPTVLVTGGAGYIGSHAVLALKDAGLSASDIDDVILVGGQTRMPKVQEAVAGFIEYFGVRNRRKALLYDLIVPTYVTGIGIGPQLLLQGNGADNVSEN